MKTTGVAVVVLSIRRKMSNYITVIKVPNQLRALPDAELLIEIDKLYEISKLECIRVMRQSSITGCECGCNNMGK